MIILQVRVVATVNSVKISQIIKVSELAVCISPKQVLRNLFTLQ